VFVVLHTVRYRTETESLDEDDRLIDFQLHCSVDKNVGMIFNVPESNYTYHIIVSSCTAYPPLWNYETRSQLQCKDMSC
jgi:hypothetical protein